MAYYDIQSDSFSDQITPISASKPFEEGANEMSENEIEQSKKRGPMSCVRFSDQEFAKIEKSSKAMDRSIPWLLKTAFFNSGELRPAFDKESARSLQVELNRIGNNINQIARQINQGLARGWNTEFEKINSQFTQIVQYMAVRLGNHKT